MTPPGITAVTLDERWDFCLTFFVRVGASENSWSLGKNPLSYVVGSLIDLGTPREETPNNLLIPLQAFCDLRLRLFELAQLDEFTLVS